MTTEKSAELVNAEDREFFDREIDSFLPDRVFDAHCHLWHPDHKVIEHIDNLPAVMGYEECRSVMGQLMPRRDFAALFIPWPEPGQELPAGQWVASQAKRDPRCRGSFIVTPKDDPEWVRQTMRELGLCGMKCYHTFAPVQPAWEAELPTYLPEPLVKVAHEESWVITLHMVRSRAVADETNIHWIRHYCENYPNMKMILAHSARAFQPAHGLEGLPQLTGLDNLYCDASANCEPIAHQAIIRILGHEKLLFGTDLPVCFLRGRSLSVADTFLWLYGDTPVWGDKGGRTCIHPALIGLEHLRSLKWACWSERLTDSQVEDVFWNNAAGLFGVA